MKKTPSPRIITQSSPTRPPSSTKPSFKFFTATAKKVAGVFAVFLFWRRRKPNSKELKSDAKQELGQDRDLYSSIDNSTGSYSRSLSTFRHSGSYGQSKDTSGVLGTFEFSLQDIYKATDNFSPANVIGQGGFGTVYKGKLKSGSFVAIKRAKRDMQDKRVSSEFRNEILTLSQIEHLNLVRFFGYLEHGDERIIVVEYVGNGTLREHLEGTRGDWLEMAELLDIAIDVAHAITYLHMYADLPIIHRDIKASNILITEKLRAKVADFGLARLAVEDPAATHISTQIKGTAGYLDPEYLRTYQLTEKSDVYSFGVLLVEMISGRQPIESTRPLNEKITIRWALKRLKDGDFIMVMDPRLRRTPASTMAVEKVLKLARQCLAPSRQSRPSMKKCAEVLWRIRKDFKEMSLSHPASTSYHSANVVERDARKGRHQLFGIEDSEVYGFRSA